LTLDTILTSSNDADWTKESVVTGNRKTFWYRRNFFINPKAQIRILLRLLVIIFVFGCGICIVSSYWVSNLRPIFDEALAGPMKPAEAFQVVSNALTIRLMGIIFLMSLSFLITGTVLTHRMTGPIWKLERELRKFLDGKEIEPLRFRRSDEFQELPALINRLLEKYPKGTKKE
jgi:hypothetical protein